VSRECPGQSRRSGRRRCRGPDRVRPAQVRPRPPPRCGLRPRRRVDRRSPRMKTGQPSGALAGTAQGQQEHKDRESGDAVADCGARPCRSGARGNEPSDHRPPAPVIAPGVDRDRDGRVISQEGAVLRVRTICHWCAFPLAVRGPKIHTRRRMIAKARYQHVRMNGTRKTQQRPSSWNGPRRKPWGQSDLPLTRSPFQRSIPRRQDLE